MQGHGADGRSRTGTAFATAPSRQRVYQFHHIGVTVILSYGSHTGILLTDIDINRDNFYEFVQNLTIYALYSLMNYARQPLAIMGSSSELIYSVQIFMEK